jgi:predicted enzyme related to lactoylglutathione lyase
LISARADYTLCVAGGRPQVRELALAVKMVVPGNEKESAMHRSRLAGFVLDSQVDDIEPAARFWSHALGYPAIHSDEEWASRYVHLAVRDKDPRMLVQKVEHQSRVHLDIETDDIGAEVKRLEALGASVVQVLPRWTVMMAPTGHRFCVVNPQRPDFEHAADVNIWPA